MRAIFLLPVVAACATVPRAPSASIEVEAHAHEVARIPNPTWIPDGVLITRLDGDTPWTRAGLQVNDVIESVNGERTTDPDAFRRAAAMPRRVRITGSRAGPVGQYRLVSIEVAAK